MLERVIYVVGLLFFSGLIAMAVSRLVPIIRREGTVEDFFEGGHTNTRTFSTLRRRVEQLRLYLLLLSVVGFALVLLGLAYDAWTISWRLVVLGVAVAASGVGLNLVLALILGWSEGVSRARQLFEEYRRGAGKRE